MGRTSKVPPTHESLTPDERRQLVGLRDTIAEREAKAKEAVLSHQDAQTEFSYCLLGLRKKYRLSAGDRIDDKTGVITRG